MHAPTLRKAQLPAQSIAQFDGLKLAFPRAEVRDLASLEDAGGLEPYANAPGSVLHKGVRHPVYCLSARLEPLAHIPPTHRECVLLGAPWGTFGIACEKVVPAAEVPSRLQSIPECMELIDSPLKGLVPCDGDIVFLTNAARLANFLLVPERGLPS
jgi:hypothetical protein